MTPALALALLAAAAAPVVERDVAVRMRDGARLRADVLRPAGPGPFPVLVYRTPYGKQRTLEASTTHARAVERGYAVVVQDVRGRYASEGEFEPYRNEGRDGYDTIEWAAAQTWSNGAVGTFGLSYPGAVQWLAAIEAPPHLKAMAPAMTYSTPRNFFHSGGVFDLSWIGWIWENIAPDARARKNLPGPRSVEEAQSEWPRVREELRRRLPLDALGELRGVAPYYFDWLAHPPGDPWWDWAEVRGKYGRVKAAVLNLSGWYDDPYGSEGAVTNFTGLLAARRSEADPRTRLILGPWVHGVEQTRATRAGERELGPSASIDYDETVLRFMDRYVRGIANGLEREKRVRAFVMGEDAWREADAWPLPGSASKPLFLAPAGRLVWSDGGRTGSVSFVSDPASPLTDPFADRPGGHDYRELPERPDAATFETEPLAEGLTVLGPVQAELRFSVDAPDTDLWVKLFDVAPDGTAFNLMSPGLDVARASYRSGGPQRELLEPGQEYMLRFGDMFTGNRFQKGHRIRVVVTTAFFPAFSRNLHTGELETVSSAMRSARVTIHCQGSRLLLPVAPR